MNLNNIEEKILLVTNSTEDDIIYMRNAIQHFRNPYYATECIYKRIWQHGDTLYQAIEVVTNDAQLKRD